MIILDRVTKSFPVEGGSKTVLDDVSVVFPTGVAVALLGRNGAGKSTLLSMISGNVPTTRGRILSDGMVSYPVGFAGTFHGDMTGAQNARFVARIYGVDTQDLMDFVEDFAELGAHFHEPVRSYSSGMKSRLAFGVSMGIGFDTYLIDEITAVGDAGFKRKSQVLFRERIAGAGAIFVSHQIKEIRQLCTAGAVLEAGKITYYPNVEDAIAAHEANVGKDD